MRLSKDFTFAVLVGASCLMVGCATPPDIVSIGNGNYEIAESPARALSSGVRAEVKVIRLADRYCEAQGREATLVTAETTNAHVGARPSSVSYDPARGVGFRAVAHAREDTPGVVFRCY